MLAQVATVSAVVAVASFAAVAQPPLVLNERPELTWIDDHRAWYRRDTAPNAHEFVLVDAMNAERLPLFDHAALAERLAARLGRQIDPARLPLDHLVVTDAELRLLVRGAPDLLVADRATLELRDAQPDDLAGFGTALVGDPGSSRHGGGETALFVHNATGHPVRLVWIDASGQRRPYGTVAPAQTHRQHTFAGHTWSFERVDDGSVLGGVRAERSVTVVHLTDASPPAPAPRRTRGRSDREARTSPDGRWRIEIVDHNVVLHDRDGAEPTRLTSGGTAEDAFVPSVFWSPCSTRVVVLRTRRGDERRVHYIESSPRDQLQPRLRSYHYLKPGDQVAQTFPHLFDPEAGVEIPLDRTLFENPWANTRFGFSADGERFTFIHNRRGHQVVRLAAVDRDTGRATALIDEVRDTFFDYSNKLFLHEVPPSADAPHGELIWMSERSGWNHLYRFDAATGAPLGSDDGRITSGEWVVRGVDRVDDQSRRIWFRAMGIHPDQDPYHVHFARVDFDGANLTLLTDGDGTHEVEPSPGGQHLVVRHSRVDLPSVTEIRCAETGSLRLELERADLVARGDSWRMPTRFVSKGRDGVTDIHGMILWPRGHDGTTTHPVIESIYAGPHGAHVPKSFRTRYGHQGELTDAGFIVVMIDGMGTNWRSKAFHDVAWRNIADAGFPDRIAWIRAAAQEHPSMDLERVGIYGGSAGGQNAMRALIDHHDFYKVAVADCGCHDNRMDKIWWNEAWMGWPVGEWYEASSNVAHADRMQGRLLLIVGEMDENVDPASTTQVVDALIRADKDFEFLLIPGAGHGAAETPYGRRKRREFFERHLK